VFVIIRSSDLHTLEIPHEPGESIVIRKLNRKQMRRAAEKRSANAFTKLIDMGGAAFMKAAKEMFDGDDKQGKDLEQQAKEAAESDPLQVYDEDTLLELGIAAWSYREVDPSDETVTRPVELSAETRDSIDEKTAAFIATAIVKFHRGELVDSKNDSPRS
jgi:hypothetical protein